MRKIKLATNDLESGRRLIIALQNRDVKTLFEALESASFSQEMKGMTDAGVDIRRKESREDLDLRITLDYEQDQREEIILTRFGPDTVASFGENLRLKPDCPGAFCNVFHDMIEAFRLPYCVYNSMFVFHGVYTVSKAGDH